MPNGKFHINKRGMAVQCHASKRPCPLGSANHFDSLEEAEEASRQICAKKYGTLGSSEDEFVPISEFFDVNCDLETFKKAIATGKVDYLYTGRMRIGIANISSSSVAAIRDYETDSNVVGNYADKRLRGVYGGSLIAYASAIYGENDYQLLSDYMGGSPIDVDALYEKHPETGSRLGLIERDNILESVKQSYCDKAIESGNDTLIHFDGDRASLTSKAVLVHEELNRQSSYIKSMPYQTDENYMAIQQEVKIVAQFYDRYPELSKAYADDSKGWLDRLKERESDQSK